MIQLSFIKNSKKIALSLILFIALILTIHPLPATAKIIDPGFDPPPTPPHEEECEVELLFGKLIILPIPDNPHPISDSPSPEKLRQLADKLEQKGMTEKALFLRQFAEALEAIQSFCQEQPTDPDNPGTGEGDIGTGTGIH